MPDQVCFRAQQEFTSTELVDLTLPVNADNANNANNANNAIKGWIRFAIAFRKMSA